MRSAVTDAVTDAVTVTESQFTMRRLNDLVPANPPQRPIRVMVDGVQRLWARLEAWARQPARGLCAVVQN